MVNWKNISPTEFEELCYLLLEKNNFEPTQWCSLEGTWRKYCLFHLNPRILDHLNPRDHFNCFGVDLCYFNLDHTCVKFIFGCFCEKIFSNLFMGYTSNTYVRKPTRWLLERSRTAWHWIALAIILAIPASPFWSICRFFSSLRNSFLISTLLSGSAEV